MAKKIAKCKYMIRKDDPFGPADQTRIQASSDKEVAMIAFERIQASSDKEVAMIAFEVPESVEGCEEQYELDTREKVLSYLINEDMCGDISIYNITKDEAVNLEQFKI